ncbi:MAG: hypothetical protein JWP12_3565 [Bacteroidetes bacterium]|nr:hypothetical protein [Bacteroidota bacterium]
MCFSTTASLTAGAILCATSVVAIKNAKTSGQKILGFTPFFFGVQQLIEGFVWLSLKTETFASLNMPATYLFLFFAQVFWPTWMPLVILSLEKDRSRGRILQYIAGLGMFCSLLLATRMILFPVHSGIDNHHILYTFITPFHAPAILSVIYLIPAVIPTFVSTTWRMPFLGVLTIGSLIASKIFYGLYALSVWCFFAAIISLVMIYIIRHLVVADEENEMRRLVF